MIFSQIKINNMMLINASDTKYNLFPFSSMLASVPLKKGKEKYSALFITVKFSPAPAPNHP